MRMSLSLESADEGRGAEIGVNEEYCWLRFVSPDPKASGDPISPIVR